MVPKIEVFTKKWGAKPDFHQAGLKISNYNLSGHRYQKKLTGPPQGRNHRKHFTIIYDLNYRPTSNAVVLCYLIAVQKVVFSTHEMVRWICCSLLMTS